MKILKDGMANVAKIINKKTLSEEKQYRMSQFVFYYKENSRFLLQNIMTDEVTELTETEWNAVEDLKKEPHSYEYLVSNGLTELAVKRYIVESDTDDVKQYQQTVFLLKTISGKSKGLKNYTILPTTGCNARCIYCYEEGYEVKTMTEETAEKLVDFICETKQDDTIHLNWFGGEPLSGANIIRNICSGLQEKGVSYFSTMVTNASLMTKEMAHEAKELWKLRSVQISLDGVKEDYTVRKAYYNPEKHNYDVVMQAVHYLLDEGIKVNMRVNVDFDNIKRIRAFLEEIKAEFDDTKNITLYFVPLYQAQKSDKIMELYQELFRLTAYQKELGIEPTKMDGSKRGVLLNRCMADSLDKCITITPDGKFNNCEHLCPENSWGNVFEGVTNKARFDEMSQTAPIDEKCSKCQFLPFCTPFYKNGCPGWFEKCYEFNCMRMNYSLYNLSERAEDQISDDSEEI